MAGFSSRKPLWAHGIEYDNLMPISFLSDLTLSAAIPVEVSNNFTKTTITDDTRNITQHIILPNVDSLSNQIDAIKNERFFSQKLL